MKEWPKEDINDVADIRKKYFGNAQDREKAQQEMQKDFDRLKADGKIPESLHGMIMSDELKLGIKFIIFQSMHDTEMVMREMAEKTKHPVDKSQVLLNYANMILQVVQILINESLEYQYKLLGDLEEIARELHKYRDLMRK
jgi:hypothetical protein